jgi:peptidyl-tRNA hydrolase
MQDLEHDKLYLAVRADLVPGLAAAQAVHAALQFQQQHPDVVMPWMRDSQFLVIVSVSDEIALIGLASRALEAGIDVSTWHEPDMADSATAVALQPGAVARRLCASLPLHGRSLAEAV